MPLFPYKLHQLLDEVDESDELKQIVSWLPGGETFKLYSADLFEEKVLKTYFPRQSRVKSFLRQLQYYGFENFGGGVFSHPKFRRGQRNICGQIIHQLPTKSQKFKTKSTRPLRARGRKKKPPSPSPEKGSETSPNSPGTSAEELSISPSLAPPDHKGAVMMPTLGSKLKRHQRKSPSKSIEERSESTRVVPNEKETHNNSISIDTMTRASQISAFSSHFNTRRSFPDIPLSGLLPNTQAMLLQQQRAILESLGNASLLVALTQLQGPQHNPILESQGKIPLPSFVPVACAPQTNTVVPQDAASP